MRIVDIIAKKRDGLALNPGEIGAFVRGVSDGTIPDEQSAALLMAIRIRGMDSAETAALTLAMAHSGAVADLSAIPGLKVDKHSTGGVADTTTLIAVPLAAACGAKIAKMSGRSLGHTGGTLDKLWSIPGARTDFSADELVGLVRRVGCAVVGQTGELAPADKKLYALRDVTATVDSIPLIASSILSKKIAAGCDAIVLDVKHGSGAILRDDASALAHSMVEIGKLAGKRVLALVTDMSQPLGRNVGNALEVREAIEILSGEATGPLLDLSMRIAAHMVRLGGIAETLADAEKLVSEALRSGAGLAKLCDMIAAQGGDARVVNAPSLLPNAPCIIPVFAKKEGVVQAMRCDQIGLTAQSLGAGRARKEDAIDPAVGLIMNARIGERVTKTQPLAYLHARDENSAKNAAGMLLSAVDIGDEQIAPPKLVLDVIE